MDLYFPDLMAPESKESKSDAKTRRQVSNVRWKFDESCYFAGRWMAELIVVFCYSRINVGLFSWLGDIHSKASIDILNKIYISRRDDPC
jgi:hypothetical protein